MTKTNETVPMVPGTCLTCEHWACMNRNELIGACTIWHDSGKTWPKSWESCPHWEHEKKKEARGNDQAF